MKKLLLLAILSASYASAQTPSNVTKSKNATNAICDSVFCNFTHSFSEVAKAAVNFNANELPAWEDRADKALREIKGLRQSIDTFSAVIMTVGLAVPISIAAIITVTCVFMGRNQYRFIYSPVPARPADPAQS